MTLKREVNFYEDKIPGCFPAEQWDFQDVRSVAAVNMNTLREEAKRVWGGDKTRYDFDAILLADVKEIEVNGKIIYYGASIGCTQRLI